MHLLEITLQRRTEAAWPVVAFHEDGRGLRVRIHGELRLDEAELQQAWIDVRRYGTLLGQSLFRGELAEALAAAREGGDGAVRVLLFVEAEDLKHLRWERLCAPVDGGWDHLVLDQRTPFTLFLPTGNDPRFPPVGRRELRALIVAASPVSLEKDFGLVHFDAESAARAVATALGDIGSDVLGPGPDAVGPPTLDALSDQLTARHYAILHVIGHGRFAQPRQGRGPVPGPAPPGAGSAAGSAGQAVLYLADDEGAVDPVPGARLITRLGRLGTLPRLTFLASCETATGDVGQGLGGLAAQLVRQLGMPAVIAMTDRVTIATASALTRAFYRQVRRHGEIDRALVEATAGLGEARDVTVPALFSRLRGHPLFSEALDQPLEPDDIYFGLTRGAELLQVHAPVLREAFERAAGIVRLSAAAEREGRTAPREEQERAVAELEHLCEEAFDISFHALALGREAPSYDARCPFRGLYPFRLEDREFFFGREEVVRRLVKRLSAEGFLAVLGASGSGKSSVVLAGLVPALQARDPGLRWASCTPGSAPATALEAALHGDPALVVVDQFEEVFTLCTDEGKRRAFLDRVCMLRDERLVVLTMRADFWGECAPHRALRELMVRHQELLAPMDESELRQAIERQADHVGLRFEADLPNTVLDDLEGEPGSMPLLQHALLELWNRRHGRWLRTDEYRGLGGVRQAIARTADAVFDRLDQPERDRVRDILVRLTRLDDDALRGEPRRDTRRRVELDELVPAGTDPAATKAIVARLADARLVVTSPDPTAGKEEVEVAHEALIRHWPRLRRWLDDDHVRIRLRESIRRAAREWQKAAPSRRESLLTLRGTRLDEALALAAQPLAVNELERSFVVACEALRTREQAESDEQRALLADREADQQLREQADRIDQDLQYRPFDAMVEAAALVGANRRRLPDRILAPVASCLHLAVELARERTLALGHGSAVASVAVSPDGMLVATGGHDGTVRLWAPTGEPQGRPFAGHEGAVTAVAFAPDGEVVASAGEDGTVRLWRLAGADAGTVAGSHGDAVTTLAFAAPGTLVSGGDDGWLRVWGPGGGERASCAPEGGVACAAVSPDGAAVAIGGYDGRVRLWDGAGGDVGEPFGAHDGLVTSVAFAPDGEVVASAGEDGTVRLWDRAGHPRAEPFAGHTGVVMAVAFSPDGSFLASGGADRTLRLFDRRGRPVAEPMVGHGDYVLGIAFSPDGSFLASAAADRTLRLWDFGHQLRPALFGHGSDVNSVAVAPDGATIVSGGADRSVRFWAADGTTVWVIAEAHRDYVYSVAFNPDGTLIASAGADRMVRLWTVAGDAVGSPLEHPDMVTRVVFSPDGRSLVTACGDGALRRWRTDGTPEGPPMRIHAGAALVCAYSPEGHLVASGGEDGTVRLWNVITGDVTDSPPGKRAGIACLAFRPAAGDLVTGALDGTLQGWDLQGRPIGPPRAAHDGELRCVAVVDGVTVTGGADGLLRLSDASGAQIGRPMRSHDGTVWTVALGPGGAPMASGGSDGTIRLWRGGSWPTWLALLCERLRGHPGRGEASPEAWQAAYEVCEVRPPDRISNQESAAPTARDRLQSSR